MLNKSNTDSEMPERRRDSSIKKILSNQPLEKQEYVGKKFNSKKIFSTNICFFSIEINQKVQNSTVGASKVHSNNDQTGVERSNSLSGRKYLHVQKTKLFYLLRYKISWFDNNAYVNGCK
jgi:hypothetical protein